MRTFLGILFAAVVTAGCANDAIPVSVAFDPVVPFPAKATYSWDRGAIRMPKDPHIVDLHLESIIEEVAEQSFAARGYTRVDAAGDYHLSYHFQVASWIGPDNSSANAVLSFLLVEPETERRIWTGWGRSGFSIGATAEERRARLTEAMTSMLENFPPGASAK